MKQFAPSLTVEQQQLMDFLLKDNDNISARLNHFLIEKNGVLCKVYKNKIIVQDNRTRYTIYNDAFARFYDYLKQVKSNNNIAHTIQQLRGEE